MLIKRDNLEVLFIDYLDIGVGFKRATKYKINIFSRPTYQTAKNPEVSFQACPPNSCGNYRPTRWAGICSYYYISV